MTTLRTKLKSYINRVFKKHGDSTEDLNAAEMSSGEQKKAIDQTKSVEDDSIEPAIPLVEITRTASLLSIPQEIRDHIYAYLLRSPTGYVFGDYARNTQGMKLHGDDDRRILFMPMKRSLNPNEPMIVNPPEVFEFQFLRTCKQIYYEAKDEVFRSNTVIVLNLGAPRFPRIQSPLGQRIQHVWTNSGFHVINDFNTYWNRRPWKELNSQLLAHTLKQFHRWGRRSGVLKSITVCIANSEMELAGILLQSTVDPSQLEKCLVVMRKDQVEWIIKRRNIQKKLRAEGVEAQLTTKPGYPFVQRRLEVQCDAFGEHTLKKRGQILASMHAAFGGELWVNDSLWLKDGRVMSDLVPGFISESRAWVES